MHYFHLLKYSVRLAIVITLQKLNSCQYDKYAHNKVQENILGYKTKLTTTVLHYELGHRQVSLRAENA